MGKVITFLGDNTVKNERPATKAARQRSLRQQATYIVSLLPEDTGEALQVLAYATRLVQEFIEKG